jgi:Na+/phosphate symporter
VVVTTTTVTVVVVDEVVRMVDVVPTFMAVTLVVLALVLVRGAISRRWREGGPVPFGKGLGFYSVVVIKYLCMMCSHLWMCE